MTVEALYVGYFSRLRGHACRYLDLSSRFLAEDVVQDSFVIAFEYEKHHHISSAHALLNRIIQRTAKEHNRRRKLWARLEDPEIKMATAACHKADQHSELLAKELLALLPHDRTKNEWRERFTVGKIHNTNRPHGLLCDIWRDKKILREAMTSKAA